MSRVKLSDLANNLGLQIIGDSDYLITGINWLSKASETEIAVAYSPDDIENSRANVILSEPCLVKTEKTLLFCTEFVELAMIKIAEYLVKCEVYQDHSINNSNYRCENGSMISENAVIGKNVRIAPFTIIDDNVIIGDNCIIESNVRVFSGTMIKDNVVLRSGSVIGGDPHFCVMNKIITPFCGVKGVILENDVSIGTNSVVQRGVLSDTIIKIGSKIGDLVIIGHDSEIGHHSRIISQSGISGCVSIGNHTVIYGQVGIANNVKVGNYVTVKGKASVVKDIPDCSIVSGILGKIKKNKEC